MLMHRKKVILGWVVILNEVSEEHAPADGPAAPRFRATVPRLTLASALPKEHPAYIARIRRVIRDARLRAPENFAGPQSR
jgi:hypothetical protein